jgi:putative membrane protein
MTSFQIVLFLHVVLVASWFGGAAMMAMVLRDSIRTGNAESMNSALLRVQRWNLMMYIPVSILVLATGTYMLWDKWYKIGAPLQLYALVKERFGSLFILLFILFVAILGKKWLKQASDAKDAEKTASILKRYINVLNLSLLAMTILIFFVTTKFS